MLASGALMLTQHAYATRIYKSVDANGNVTYSSRPPSDAVTIEKITLTRDYDVTPDTDTLANIDAIKQTADKLEQERMQREKKRKEAQAEAEKQAKKQTNTPPETVIRYYPVYPFYYYPGKPYPPRPHPHRPRPPHSPIPMPSSPSR